MRVWTVQPKAVYTEILKKGVFQCDPAKSVLVAECEFGPAYDWLSVKMTEQVGPPPDGIKYPVWARHTMNWEHKRPDMRRCEFRRTIKPYVLIEAEIDDERVLLSDEENWHFVLNNCYYSASKTDEALDSEYEWLESLTEEEHIDIKKKYWERIFEVSPYDDGFDRHGCYIQTTFWELRKEDIVKVWIYE